jgi:hypothetical protein
MKRTSLLVLALVGALAADLPAQTGLIARIHFAGANRIAADPNHTAFTGEFSSAEARAMESQVLDRLSRVPGEWFQAKIPAGAGDGATQLRPLLDDCLKSEWIFEMRDMPGSPEYALAIRLPPARAELWSRNLAALLQSWTGIKISADKSGNWELKKHDPPNLFRFSHAGDWIVMDCGENKLTLGNDVVQGATANDGWLSVEANWPRLAQLFPTLKAFDFPKFQIQAVGRAGKLQLTGKLTLAQPMPPLEKWRLPAEAIHQPLISFTAVRGVGPWLARQPWMRPFVLPPQPDQLFLWARAHVPFQTYAAEPVPNAQAALAQLHQHLTADDNWESQFMNRVGLVMTNSKISLRGLPPLITPFVQAWHEPAGDFLLGGFFANPLKAPSAAAELDAPLRQPNLVYYHWEATAERLKELPQFSQLLLVLTRRQQVQGQSAAGKWLDHIEPSLGASVTTVTETTPTELAFQRTAPGGLTALELIAFVDWVEAPEFPALDLRLPPPRVHPGQRSFRMLSTPSGSAPRRQ